MVAIARRVVRGVRLWVLKAFVAVERMEVMSDSVWHFLSTTMAPLMGEIVFIIDDDGSWFDIGIMTIGVGNLRWCRSQQMGDSTAPSFNRSRIVQRHCLFRNLYSQYVKPEFMATINGRFLFRPRIDWHLFMHIVRPLEMSERCHPGSQYRHSIKRPSQYTPSMALAMNDVHASPS